MIMVGIFASVLIYVRVVTQGISIDIPRTPAGFSTAACSGKNPDSGRPINTALQL